MQRLIDIVFALAILLLTTPIWIVTLIVVTLSDFGSPFFLQNRVGRNEKVFRLVKFRTMTKNASVGSNLTVSGDKRVTPIGRVLRRLKIDELPQLLNVLVGSMSIVGPRPETPEYVALYDQAEREVLKYRPGLTDPSSIKYRHEERILAKYSDPVEAYKSVILPDKIAISLEYQHRRNLASDLAIIGETILAIFRPAEDSPH